MSQRCQKRKSLFTKRTALRRCRYLENNALSTRHSDKTRAGLACTLFREFKVGVQKLYEGNV
jgi:hypothetical protein